MMVSCLNSSKSQGDSISAIPSPPQTQEARKKKQMSTFWIDEQEDILIIRFYWHGEFSHEHFCDFLSREELEDITAWIAKGPGAYVEIGWQ